MDTATAMDSDKPRKPIAPAAVLAAALVIAVASAAAFAWQYQRSVSLQSQLSNLNTQLTSLQEQKTQLQAARTVSTATWKLACDQHNNVCFKLPPDWNPNSFSEDSDVIGELLSTNPSKSLMVSYRNHYIVDGGEATFHVSSITNIPDSSLGLKIVGGYYVAENRQPFYIVVGNDQVTNYGYPLQVGRNVPWGNTERFEITTSGVQDDIQFLVHPEGRTYPSSQSADAWFNSTDGLTALSILSSLVRGSVTHG